MRELINIVESVEKSTVNSLGRIIAPSPEAIERFWSWFGKSAVKTRTGQPIVAFHGTDGDFNAFDPDHSNRNTNTGVPHGAVFFSDNAETASSYAIERAGDGTRFARQEDADTFYHLMKNGSFDDQMDFLANAPRVPDVDWKDGGNVMPVYLRITKPLRVDAKGDHWNDIYFKPKDYRQAESFTVNEIAEYAEDNGYDGVIIKNVKDNHKMSGAQGTTYIVFNSNQVKSAIASGFSPDRAEIDEVVLASTPQHDKNAMRELINVTESYGDFYAVERSTVNSLGRVIAPTPEAIERFWSWFGESKIKSEWGEPIVVFHGTDKDFNVFDPTRANSNAGTGVPKGTLFFSDSPETAASYAMSYKGEGLRFVRSSDEKKYHELLNSGSYQEQIDFLASVRREPDINWKPGGNIIPAYVRMLNPLQVGAEDRFWSDIPFQPKGFDQPIRSTTNEIAQYAKENGYDGVVIWNVRDNHRAAVDASGNVYIVFNSNQVKSAIASGFSPDRAEIDEEQYPEGIDTDDMRTRYDDFMKGAAESEAKEANFKRWFAGSKVVDDQGRPLVLYHGTGSDFDSFKGMVWGSVTRALAGEYAAMRGMESGQNKVYEIFMRITQPFDADLGLTKAVTVGSFFNEMIEQAIAAGNPPSEEDIATIRDLIEVIQACRREEESGPHYDRWNFWNETRSRFGTKGAEAIRQIFDILGFDGVKMEEGGEMTWGAFSPTQVKSVWNSGLYGEHDRFMESD